MLSDDERETLLRWARRAKSSQALAMRSRIVLACADGAPNTAVAAQLGVSRDMVGKWRSRFIAKRLEVCRMSRVRARPGRSPMPRLRL